MEKVPDLDDLLDRLESEIIKPNPAASSAIRPSFDARNRLADSITEKAFSSEHGTSSNTSAPRPSTNGNSHTTEEKLSFVEFLKVTAREAEELQRLHDDSNSIVKSTPSSLLDLPTEQQEVLPLHSQPVTVAELPDLLLPSPPTNDLLDTKTIFARNPVLLQEASVVLEEESTVSSGVVSADFNDCLEYLARFDENGEEVEGEERGEGNEEEGETRDIKEIEESRRSPDQTNLSTLRDFPEEASKSICTDASSAIAALSVSTADTIGEDDLEKFRQSQAIASESEETSIEHSDHSEVLEELKEKVTSCDSAELNAIPDPTHNGSESVNEEEYYKEDASKITVEDTRDDQPKDSHESSVQDVSLDTVMDTVPEQECLSKSDGEAEQQHGKFLLQEEEEDIELQFKKEVVRAETTEIVEDFNRERVQVHVIHEEREVERDEEEEEEGPPDESVVEVLTEDSVNGDKSLREEEVTKDEEEIKENEEDESAVDLNAHVALESSQSDEQSTADLAGETVDVEEEEENGNAEDTKEVASNSERDEEVREEDVKAVMRLWRHHEMDEQEERQQQTNGSQPAPPRSRFSEEVIAQVHGDDEGEEEGEGTPKRLTESEMQLGKAAPFWIPDADCSSCMLCSARFSFLHRRHHCRACGRVLCAACCPHQATLAYQKENNTKKSRVCAPCLSILSRIEEMEKERESAEGGEEREAGEGALEGDNAENMEPSDSALLTSAASSSQATSGTLRKKSILKVRTTSESADMVDVPQPIQQMSSSAPSDSASEAPASRRVVFRDGVKPGEGAHSEEQRVEAARAGEEEPRLVPNKPSKRKQKRALVARRVAALRVEEQIASLLPAASFTTTPSTEASSSSAAMNDSPSKLLLLLQNDSGTGELVQEWKAMSDVEESLAAERPVKIAVNRLFSCILQICEAPAGSGKVVCVVSDGLHSVGLDEIVFLWKLDENLLSTEEVCRQRYPVPIHVMQRINEILTWTFGVTVPGCSSSSPGVAAAPVGQETARMSDVRRVCVRLAGQLHVSVDELALPPLTQHTLLFHRTHQSIAGLPLSPSLPFVFACPVLPPELPWALATPNRLLLRLGLKASNYPSPLVSNPFREAVYTDETSLSVVKMFTDFSNWQYRMRSVPGSTVTLTTEETKIELPCSARALMRQIIDANRKMVAFLADINSGADSHLVCAEKEGMYETTIFQRGGSRSATGATFVVIDGGLKTAKQNVQVSLCEDGIAVRFSADCLIEVVNALLNMENITISGDEGTRVTIQWNPEIATPASSQLQSPIDNSYLGDKMQYGLQLERAISSSLQSSSMSNWRVRLSHVFNLRENTLPVEDEAKVFSVVEMVFHEAASALDSHLPLLLQLGTPTTALRLIVTANCVEYAVSQWAGLEEEQRHFTKQLDNLVPLLYNVLGYIPHGFIIEMFLTAVHAESPPPMP